MKIHPEITHLQGIVSVTLKAQFVGDATDDDDRRRIAAYGDPLVNLGGQFTGLGDPAPIYATTSAEVWVGLTQGMPKRTIRFMTQLPEAAPGQLPATLGPLDVLTSDPVGGATVYVTAIQARVASAMATLRAKTPIQLTSLPDTTV